MPRRWLASGSRREEGTINKFSFTRTGFPRKLGNTKKELLDFHLACKLGHASDGNAKFIKGQGNAYLQSDKS